MPSSTSDLSQALWAWHTGLHGLSGVHPINVVVGSAVVGASVCAGAVVADALVAVVAVVLSAVVDVKVVAVVVGASADGASVTDVGADVGHFFGTTNL